MTMERRQSLIRHSGLVIRVSTRFPLPPHPASAHNRLTMRTLFLTTVAVLLTTSFTHAAAIPPGADGAEKALAASPRHGEYVDIEIPAPPGAGDPAQKLRAWVVYPERKEKAGVVIVIHEIFGLTDWVR